jgi:hypothetical protein
MPILIPPRLFATAPAPAERHFYEVGFDYALNRNGLVQESGNFDAWPVTGSRTTRYGWLVVGQRVLFDSDRAEVVSSDLEPYGCRLLGGVLETIYELLPKLEVALTEGEIGISPGPYTGENDNLNPHGKVRFSAIIGAGGSHPAEFLAGGVELLICESYNSGSLGVCFAGPAGFSLRKAGEITDLAHVELGARVKADFEPTITDALGAYQLWIKKLGLS